MRQRASFWSWRAATKVGKFLELGIIGFVLFIFVLAGAEAVHKPIVADRVHHQHIVPVAHAK